MKLFRFSQGIVGYRETRELGYLLHAPGCLNVLEGNRHKMYSIILALALLLYTNITSNYTPALLPNMEAENL